MATDWASEHFVRLYTRETDDDLLLSWEARAVWHELLKKFDKQGRLSTKRGARGLAALIRVPFDVVERAIAELVEDGRLKQEGGLFFAPNYQHANYTPRSPAARMHQLRTRTGLHGAGGGDTSGDGGTSHSASAETGELNNYDNVDKERVTDSDAALRDVTARSHIRSGSGQSKTKHSAASRGRAGSRCAIPADWEPRPRERELAEQLGVDCDSEAREFLVYWLGDGRAKADWDQTFAARLESVAKRKRTPGKPEEQRHVDEL
jgi:hypothetical protein